MAAVINAVQPRYVFAENVSRRAIENAAADLAAMGYACRAIELSAADLGADHVRSRFWLRAYADDKGQLRRKIDAEVAIGEELRSRVWEAFTDESGMADGMAHRMERYRAIGNGQVPCVAATAWRLLK
jgi:DNA (cytosine-5)-methyltransferase 1